MSSSSSSSSCLLSLNSLHSAEIHGHGHFANGTNLFLVLLPSSPSTIQDITIIWHA